LKSKHPKTDNYGEDPEFNRDAIAEVIKTFVPLLEDQVTITPLQFMRCVSRLKPGVRPGVDQLRNEHLKSMVGNCSEKKPTENKFCVLMSSVLTIVARGSAPRPIVNILRDNELMALGKVDSDDVRPIGVGGSLRKIISTCLFQSDEMKEFNARHFAEHQYGLDRNGIELVAHDIKRRLKLDPTLDLYSVDADNAFNRSNRLRGLNEVKKFRPGLLPFLRDMYLESSSGWFMVSILVLLI